MKIYKHTIRLLLLGVLPLLAGCAEDYFGDNDRVKGDEVAVHMDVSSGTRAEGAVGSNIENSLTKIRVMIFSAKTGIAAGIPPGHIILNEVYTKLDEIPVQKVTPGLRDFYVIANETAEMAAKLDLVKTVSQLETIKLGYDAALIEKGGSPFVMAQSRLAQKLVGGSSIKLPFELLRVSAKVRFKLSFNASSASEEGGLKDKPLKIDSVRILRISDSSNVVTSGLIYTASKSRISRHIGAHNPAIAKNWVFIDSLYIAERIFSSQNVASDTSKATYMMVYAKADNVPCRYRINIGDVASKGVIQPDYTVTRNTQYNVVGTFTKIGETDGIDIKVTVSPWNNFSWTDNVGVAPKITKTIEEFTPCDGRAEFSVLLDEPAQWRVQVDNAADFAIYGDITNMSKGGTFSVVPRKFHKGEISKTRVHVIVNGQIVDESTVTANGNWKFNWESVLLTSGTKSLIIMDRNLGASGAKGAGCLYKFGSRTGVSSNYPPIGVAPNAESPVPTWSMKDWDGNDYQTVNHVRWTDIEYQSEQKGWINDPCPPGWRVLKIADWSDVISPILNSNVRSYGDFANGSQSGRIIIDAEGKDRYLTVMNYRDGSTGKLMPDDGLSLAVKGSYYWSYDFSTGNSARNISITSTKDTYATNIMAGAFAVRCCADVKFDYKLTYPNHNDAEITVQRNHGAIETPLNQTTDLVHYIDVINGLNIPWTLTGYEVSSSWITVEKVGGEAGEPGAGEVSGKGMGRIKVTIKPNNMEPKIGEFRPVRQILLSLNSASQSYKIIVHQGGYVNIDGYRWLDRALQYGQTKDDFQRVYPAAIPIGFSKDFRACSGRHKECALTSADALTPSGAYAGGLFFTGDNNDAFDSKILTGTWASTKTGYDPCPTGWKVPSDAQIILIPILPISQQYYRGSLTEPAIGSGYSDPNSGRFCIINSQYVFFPWTGSFDKNGRSVGNVNYQMYKGHDIGTGFRYLYPGLTYWSISPGANSAAAIRCVAE